MDTVAANPIQMARNMRHKTQEELAELMYVSTDTVQAWERGTRIPDPKTLDTLSDKLDCPWLSLIYLRDRSASMARILPDFTVGRPLPEAAAAYISSVMDLVDIRFDRRLLRMMADGRIDELEAQDYAEIMEASTCMIKAYFDLLFAAERKE